MNIVIDTNIIVAAALRDAEAHSVLRFVLEHGWTWYTSTDIVAEYNEVLSRSKFALAPAVLHHWSQAFAKRATLVEVDPTVTFTRDQKDAKFVACVLAVNADYLVTNDRHLRSARRRVTATICSSRQFTQSVIDRAGCP